jgi:hypothetical protein
MSFGTGLNTFLTAIAATETKRRIHYIAIETTPLSLEEVAPFNYPENLAHKEIIYKVHCRRWKEEISINEFFFHAKNQSIGFQLFNHQIFQPA